MIWPKLLYSYRVAMHRGGSIGVIHNWTAKMVIYRVGAWLCILQWIIVCHWVQEQGTSLHEHICVVSSIQTVRSSWTMLTPYILHIKSMLVFLYKRWRKLWCYCWDLGSDYWWHPKKWCHTLILHLFLAIAKYTHYVLYVAIYRCVHIIPVDIPSHVPFMP